MWMKAQWPDYRTSTCGGYYSGDEVSWDVVIDFISCVVCVLGALRL